MKAAKSLLMLAFSALLTPGVIPAGAMAGSVGQFDGQTGVGFPKLAGSANYAETGQEYTVAGSGSNMWFANDQFHFLWKQAKGNFILRARMEFIGTGVEAHRKAGWMARAGLDADAPYVDCAEHGNGLTSLQFRRAKGAVTEEITLPITNADAIQFERRGNTFIFSAAKSGGTFTSAQISDVAMPDEMYAGLFVCSHNAEVLEKAVFHNVRTIRPAKEGFVPYRDYIGSTLEIVDIATGRSETVLNSAQPFEAPNWTRDGKALIYNISGRAEGWGALSRLDLATRRAAVINTDFANRNNNDHVLSFDSTMLGISDQSAGHGGKSRVFTVPVGGGTPKKITELTPSYMHGWSPDGKFLVYTGGRDGKYDIYKVSAAGGSEIRLTDAEGLNDGPEYSPDGNYIYFNSSRTGKMQLWRMKPDGTGQEQLTKDAFNNWFPHVSPDGKWIAFLSFSGEISPTDHPYYKQVYLRLMPIEGGEAKVIEYVYGGQGTMNVPSWSPDSRRIAYVSNSDLE